MSAQPLVKIFSASGVALQYQHGARPGGMQPVERVPCCCVTCIPEAVPPPPLLIRRFPTALEG